VKRILLISAAAVAAGGIAATPAIAGLAGNSSFSHQIPVRVPSQAHAPQLVDDHSDGPGTVHARPSATPSRHPEPGDDRGGSRRTAEPGDDRGATSHEPEPGDDHRGSASSEPGDDRGGSRGEPEPGDDRSASSSEPEPGDDHGSDG
jgi:hypothetical protein